GARRLRGCCRRAGSRGVDRRGRSCPSGSVIHHLTALPKDAPRRPGDLDAANRLRADGTRNLLEAAIRTGARRFLVGSFALLSPRPRGPADADFDDAAAAAVRSMENRVLDATRRGSIEGVI